MPVFFAAVPGASAPGISARRAATAARRTIGTTTSASVLPDPFKILPLYFLCPAGGGRFFSRRKPYGICFFQESPQSNSVLLSFFGYGSFVNLPVWPFPASGQIDMRKADGW